MPPINDKTPFLKRTYARTPYTLLAKSLSNLSTCNDQDGPIKSPTSRAAARHSSRHQSSAIGTRKSNLPASNILQNERINNKHSIPYNMDSSRKRKRAKVTAQSQNQSPSDHNHVSDTDDEEEDYGQSGDYEHWLDPSLDQSEAASVDRWNISSVQHSHGSKKYREILSSEDTENRMVLPLSHSSTSKDNSVLSSSNMAISKTIRVPFQERPVSKLKEYKDLLGQLWVVDDSENYNIKIEGFVRPSRNRPGDDLFFSGDTPSSHHIKKTKDTIIPSQLKGQRQASQKNLLTAFNHASAYKGMSGVIRNNGLTLTPSSRRASLSNNINGNGSAGAVTFGATASTVTSRITTGAPVTPTPKS